MWICRGSPDCSCRASKADIRDYYKKQTLDDSAICPSSSCGHLASDHEKPFPPPLVSPPVDPSDLERFVEKLRSGDPVLVSEIQAYPRLATRLIDAVDYGWHIELETIPDQSPTLVLEDCPKLGVSAVGLDCHSRGKIKKFTVPAFSALEVLVLLRQALHDEDISFSSIHTLWSFLGGDVNCYHSMFHAGTLSQSLTDPLHAQSTATGFLQQERMRIQGLLAGRTHIFELWQSLSKKPRFQHQDSGAFSWLLSRDIITQQSFLGPSQKSYLMTPGLSQNALSCETQRAHGFDSLVASAVSAMAKEGLWPFPFERKQFKEITPELVKIRKTFNDVVFFIRIGSEFEVVIHAIDGWGQREISEALRLLSRQKNADQIVCVHIIFMTEKDNMQEVKNTFVYDTSFSLRFHHDNLDALTLRVKWETPVLRVEEDGWPILDRPCYKLTKKTLLRAQMTKRPLLLEGVTKSGKSTLLDVLFPGLGPETVTETLR